jgi:hypothetical protein
MKIQEVDGVGHVPSRKKKKGNNNKGHRSILFDFFLLMATIGFFGRGILVSGNAIV